jgi:hypothetical protein
MSINLSGCQTVVIDHAVMVPCVSVIDKLVRFARTFAVIVQAEQGMPQQEVLLGFRCRQAGVRGPAYQCMPPDMPQS